MNAKPLFVSLIVAVAAMASVFVVNHLQETAAMAADKEQTASKKEPQLAHMVFFTLNESNAENRAKLVEACQKLLSEHPGTVHFSVGTLNAELDRPVNDREYDVALHLVFENKAAHDKYQSSKRHVQFVDGHKDLWKKVRVFDSDVAAK